MEDLLYLFANLCTNISKVLFTVAACVALLGVIRGMVNYYEEESLDPAQVADWVDVPSSVIIDPSLPTSEKGVVAAGQETKTVRWS